MSSGTPLAARCPYFRHCKSDSHFQPPGNTYICHGQRFSLFRRRLWAGDSGARERRVPSHNQLYNRDKARARYFFQTCVPLQPQQRTGPGGRMMLASEHSRRRIDIAIKIQRGLSKHISEVASWALAPPFPDPCAARPLTVM